MARRAKAKYGSAPNGANLGFEATMWAAADKLRNNMDAAEYKHVVLGQNRAQNLIWVAMEDV